MNMNNLLITWLASSVILYITAILIPGFVITSFSRAMLASIVLGLLNAILRPVLFFVTIPINIITLGFFTFVLNAIILRLAAGLMKGFDIKGWWSAILAAITMVFLQIFMGFFFNI
jgi:putative membrane protein